MSQNQLVKEKQNAAAILYMVKTLKRLELYPWSSLTDCNIEEAYTAWVYSKKWGLNARD